MFKFCGDHPLSQSITLDHDWYIFNDLGEIDPVFERIYRARQAPKAEGAF